MNECLVDLALRKLVCVVCIFMGLVWKAFYGQKFEFFPCWFS